MSNIITANLARGRKVVTQEVFQWDSGQLLKFIGIDLPPSYRVDFSNTIRGTSKSQLGDENGVTIPDEFFLPGQMIYAWIVFTPNENSSETEYQVSVPISPRARPTGLTPSPHQGSIIDQSIAALNEAAETFKTYATDITVDNTTLVIEKVE